MSGRIKRKVLNCLIGTFLFSCTLCNTGITYIANAAQPVNGVKNFEIINPYGTVDWNCYGQYKACLHMHTTEFDGLQSPKDMLEDCYRKGYDIAAITDHDILNSSWAPTDKNPDRYLTHERLNEINSGIDRNGRGMIGIPFTTEQSVLDHVNTYWANFINKSGDTIESKIAKCEESGGISHINHPGGDASSSQCFNGEEITEIGIKYVNLYTDLFLKYHSCVGLEVFNANYGNRESFRRLWDHILMGTMPNRQVWGFSNDDTHFMTGTGYNFNILLMPNNSEENIRYSMENGTFYLVASKSNVPTEDYATGTHNVTYPVINNISVNPPENSITVTAENYDTVEWIADGKVIAYGESIDLNDYENRINTYIRAQIIGAGGMTLTQPFGIIEKSSVKLGDIDGSGVVNSIDCALLIKHLLGMDGFKLTKEKAIIADLDGNEKINGIDLAYMRKFVLGMIKVFPAEQ